jgi:hypothetical protein
MVYSLDARLGPVVALLREKSAERSSHSMTVLRRACRQRNLDPSLIDKAVRHVGGRVRGNGAVLRVELPGR